MYWRILLALTVFGAAAASAQAPQGAALPQSPLGERAAALLRAIERGDEPAVRAFFGEHVEPGFRDAFPMEQHLQVFRQMNREMSGASLVRFRQTTPTDGAATLRSAGGEEVLIRVAVAAQPPHLITEIAVGPDDSGESPAQPAPERLDEVARREVVDSVAALFARRHLFPDTGQMIASHLRSRAASGAYDGAATPQRLAAALTEDIQSVNPDRHLNVRAGDPLAGVQAGGPNQMITRSERLAGNVGYLQLGIIGGRPDASRQMEEALRSLDGTDAMILDLRGVPGGSAQMANFIISHFAPPGVHSLTVVTPATGDTAQRYTLPQVPGPRRLDVPLFVLVDGGSASAAEDIPFVLQNLGRATVVGERTAGAGRNNRVFAVGHGLSASVSWTRVIDPRSGREWERVGIEPDIRAPSAQALDVAHRAALEAALGKAADPARRAELRRALEGQATQPARTDDLAAILRATPRAKSLPAIAAAVVRGDSIVAADAVGVRRLGETAEVSLGSRFHMGSLVKEMTGLLIGDLVEEGVLSWSTTLGDALPGLRGQMHPRYRSVTLEHLVQHRAGIAPFTRLGPEQARLFASFRGTDVEQRLQFAAHLLGQEPVVEPGTEMVYSNAGYGLLAAVAEAAAGRPWEELIHERVLRPLGVRTAAFGSPPETGPDQPWGHAAEGSAFSPMPEQYPRNRAALRPAGGISMSIEDLARVARAHMLALSGTETIVRPETARRLFGDKPALLAGGNGYYTAMMSIDPEARVAVVAATNSGAEPVLREVIEALRRSYAPKACGTPGCPGR